MFTNMLLMIFAFLHPFIDNFNCRDQKHRNKLFHEGQRPLCGLSLRPHDHITFTQHLDWSKWSKTTFNPVFEGSGPWARKRRLQREACLLFNCFIQDMLEHIPVGRAPKSQNGGHHLIRLHPSCRTLEAERHTSGAAPWKMVSARNT